MMISQSMSQKCRSPDRWQAYTEPHICKYLQDTWHNEEDNRGRYITYSQASSLIPHTNIVLFSISRRRIDNKALKYIQASRCPAVPMSRSLISMAGKYWICPCTPNPNPNPPTSTQKKGWQEEVASKRKAFCAKKERRNIVWSCHCICMGYKCMQRCGD